MKQRLLDLISWGFDVTGFSISQHPKQGGHASFAIGDLTYGINIPYANYAPWKGDKGYQEAYRKIKGTTLVDKYRCYELWETAHQIAAQFPELSFLEIGVYKGGSALLLAEAMKAANSTGTLYLADTFEGVVNAGAADEHYVGGEHADTTLESTQARLKSYSNIAFLKGMFPEQTAHLIPENARFSLVHIDVDVYQSAKECLEWAWPKLALGGMVIFDDYGFHTCNGITQLVNGLKADKDKRVIHNLNGHALLVKIKE